VTPELIVTAHVSPAGRAVVAIVNRSVAVDVPEFALVKANVVVPHPLLVVGVLSEENVKSGSTTST
jgi:hypothetical protein